MEDRTVVDHGCRKTQKIICGMEGESVVAYGRLPFPAHVTQQLCRVNRPIYFINDLISYK